MDRKLQLVRTKLEKRNAKPLLFPIEIKLGPSITGWQRGGKDLRGVNGKLPKRQIAFQSKLIRRDALDLKLRRKNTAYRFQRPSAAGVWLQQFGRQIRKLQLYVPPSFAELQSAL